MTDVLIRKGTWAQISTEERPYEDTRRRLSKIQGGTHPENTLISDFQPPDPRES